MLITHRSSTNDSHLFKFAIDRKNYFLRISSVPHGEMTGVEVELFLEEGRQCEEFDQLLLETLLNHLVTPQLQRARKADWEISPSEEPYSGPEEPLSGRIYMKASRKPREKAWHGNNFPPHQKFRPEDRNKTVIIQALQGEEKAPAIVIRPSHWTGEKK